MYKFEELRVYKSSLDFIDEVYEITKNFPKDELFGLTNQLRRASTSIALNIAEGSSRTTKDFCHFLNLSRGSCYECLTILTIAKRRKYLTTEGFDDLYDTCNAIARMLNALKKSLQNTNHE